jgi:hypothetical protein
MVLSLPKIGACLLAATLCGCAGEVSFDSPDSAARLRAIQKAAADDDRSSIPKLIEMLDSDDPAVRLLSIRTLESMTGQTLGYDPIAPSYERTPAVNRWQEWYSASPAERKQYNDAHSSDNSPASDPIPSGDRNKENAPGQMPLRTTEGGETRAPSPNPHAGDAGAME